MRKILIAILLIFSLFNLTSCFELIEDTTLNNDGSGTYKLMLNFSASATKINSIMVMDSIKGKKVPSKKELQLHLNQYTHLLKEKEGISNIKSDLNTEHWILKLSLDFKSLNHLKKALISFAEEVNKKKVDEKAHSIVLAYINNNYERKIGELIPSKWKEKAQEKEDFDKLSEGKCIFIQRFDREITQVDSELLKISKNKKAAMLQLTPKQIIDKPSLIDYTITTKK